MLTGTHLIIYTRDADADRAFFRDTLGLSSVDAGKGWLIFALPPAEIAFHPAERDAGHEIFLLCDDVDGPSCRVDGKGSCLRANRRGILGPDHQMTLPGGSHLGIYQPKHARPAAR